MFMKNAQWFLEPKVTFSVLPVFLSINLHNMVDCLSAYYNFQVSKLELGHLLLARLTNSQKRK